MLEIKLLFFYVKKIVNFKNPIFKLFETVVII